MIDLDIIRFAGCYYCVKYERNFSQYPVREMSQMGHYFVCPKHLKNLKKDMDSKPIERRFEYP